MDNIRTEIQLRRHKEAMWLRNTSEYNLMAFYYQRRYYANLIKSAQRSFFLDTIKKLKGDSKALFAITNKLLHRGQQLPLPSCQDTKSVANNVNEFFIMKIEKIMQGLWSTAPEHTDNTYIETAFITSWRFSDFQHITPDEVIKIIQKCPPKSCELDLLPSTLIKQHAETVAPTIYHIVNISLLQGDLTENLKQALLGT